MCEFVDGEQLGGGREIEDTKCKFNNLDSHVTQL